MKEKNLNNNPNSYFELMDDATEEAEIRSREEENKTHICGEDYRLRKANRRIYSLTDGSKQAEFYSNSMFAYDENKEMFNQIDKSLFFDRKGKCVRTGKTNFRARFSTKPNSNELLVLEKDIYKIKLKSQILSDSKTKKNIPSIKKKNTGVDALVYEEFAPGLDLEYSIYGNGINQNIIINKKQSLYSFTFEIEYKNLEVQFNQHKKAVEFVSKMTRDVIFNIPAPFILDSRGSHSNAIFCNIKPISPGKDLLEIVLDSSWLNDVYTLFPVTASFQFELQNEFFLNTFYWVNGTMGRNIVHSVGMDWASFCNERMYLEIACPQLPADAKIKKAVLILPQKSSYSVNDFCPELGLYYVKGDIVLGKYSPWNSNESFGLTPIKIHHFEPEGTISYEFDITSAIEKMKDNSFDKSVFVLKLHNESCANTHIASFYGNTCEKFYPKLVITYN